MRHLNNPIFILYLMVAAVWIYRAFRALRSTSVIPRVIRVNHREISNADLVSVIIPAKNEEKNIRECIERFRQQDYPLLEIIIVNDSSTDKTESILQEMKIEKIENSVSPISGRTTIRYLNAPVTPEGWTGKNFALYSAVPYARGKWLLFTDADTRHEPESISSAHAHAQKKQLSFLTCLPRCLTGSFAEHMIQPLAMLYLGLWFPMEKVNRADTQTVFGNGQYLFLTRELYDRLGGHEKVKAEFLEDYALIREAKKMKAGFQCALADTIYGTRMYDSLDAMWRGWRRIFLHAFEKNAFVLLSKFLSVFCFSVLPFACFIPLTRWAFMSPDAFGFVWGAVLGILTFILITTWKAFDIIKAKKIYAVLHPAGAFMFSVFLLDACWMAVTGKKTTWR